MKDYSFLRDMLNELDNFVFVGIYFYIYGTRKFKVFILFYVKSKGGLL